MSEHDDPPHDDETPNAAELQTPELTGMLLGPPFAIADDCELLEAKGSVPGCFVSLRCDGCHQVFKLDLLKTGVKPCPKCKLRYTHAVLVCLVDDDEMVAAAMVRIAQSNGYELAPTDEDLEDLEDLEDGDEDEDAEPELDIPGGRRRNAGDDGETE